MLQKSAYRRRMQDLCTGASPVILLPSMSEKTVTELYGVDNYVVFGKTLLELDTTLGILIEK